MPRSEVGLEPTIYRLQDARSALTLNSTCEPVRFRGLTVITLFMTAPIRPGSLGATVLTFPWVDSMNTSSFTLATNGKVDYWT